MSLFRIAWRSLWSRPLVTLLTLIGIVLGMGLISSVLTLRREAERSFEADSAVFDMVVGAKGSPLQLVLSSIYHLDIPTGNIAWEDLERLQGDFRVANAVPLGLGDNYRGFRIVGTVPEIFDVTIRNFEEEEEGEEPAPEPPWIELGKGEVFEEPFEAVIGAQVAAETGLAIGDQFAGAHGLIVIEGNEEHGDFPYTVVGVLKASGGAQDRAIFTPMESVWLVHDKEEAAHREQFGGAPKPRGEGEELRGDVTAILVQLRAPGMRLMMKPHVNDNFDAMAAIPIEEMTRLFHSVIGPLQRTLLAIAAVVVIVAALSITATLYQAAERRRRDIAVMRALGARPSEVFLVVLLEALMLSWLGIALGVALGHAAIYGAAVSYPTLAAMAPGAWIIDSYELKAIGIVAVASLAAGLLPAFLAYRTNPGKDLQ